MDESLRQSRCPRCSAMFHCGASAGDVSCWCFTFPAFIPFDDDGSKECFCPDCLRVLIDQKKTDIPAIEP